MRNLEGGLFLPKYRGTATVLSFNINGAPTQNWNCYKNRIPLFKQQTRLDDNKHNKTTTELNISGDLLNGKGVQFIDGVQPSRLSEKIINMRSGLSIKSTI